MAKLFTFLLVPGFSMMDFAAVAEPLRSANRMGGELYRWRTLSQDGRPVSASNGMSIAVDSALVELDEDEVLIVVATYDPLATITPTLIQWLRRQDRAGVTIGGIDTGPFILAHADLMKGYRMTVHWEAIDSLKESFPNLNVSYEIFEIDGRRMTSAGGTSSIDMMLEVIAQSHGQEIAIRVSEQFILGKIRKRADVQRMKIPERYNFENKKIQAVIERIELSIDQDLDINELARGVCITRRQLERLFRSTLHSSPAEFRHKLRLDKAKQLLQQSTLSILQISVACGFDSPSYFAKCYKDRFNLTPRQDRAVMTGRSAVA